MCLPFRVVAPDPTARHSYDRLYAMFRNLYFGFGSGKGKTELGTVLGDRGRSLRRHDELDPIALGQMR